MKYFKHILVTFVAAIITVFFIFGGYSLYADEVPDYDKFLEFTNISSSKPFYQIKSKYHSNMNDYFNFKFEQLVSLIDKEAKFYEHKDFKAPKSDENISETCKTNVSTYCVAMGALDIYIAYLNKLNDVKGTVPEVTTTTPSIKAIADLLTTRGSEVDKDAKDSKTVMEAAINTYKEFQSAYPMHKKYRDIIKNLTKYKIALGKIRVETDKFPNKFVDSTSDKCQ